MDWMQDGFSREPDEGAVNAAKKAEAPSPEETCEKERYTYYVSAVSAMAPWIYISCNEEDATENVETFTDLVKKAAGILNDGVWEGNIVLAGPMQDDARYRIKNDPLFMVFQYDGLFGIVLEYTPGVGRDGALNYLSNVLGVTVDDKFRQPLPMQQPAPSASPSMGLDQWYSVRLPSVSFAIEVVPEGTTQIEDVEFDGQADIRKLVLPEGLETIGFAAFRNCSNLQEVILPASLKTIGFQAFSGCTRLKRVCFQAGVESIGPETFHDCSNLEEVILPSSLKEIGFAAFSRCEKLRCLQLPEGLEEIDNSAFFNCVNLEKINLPGSLKSMGEYVFSGCNKLKSAGPYGSGGSIEYGATDRVVNKMFASCRGLEWIQLPEGLETIESQAFQDCNLLAKINLPSSLKKMGDQAFAGCNKLISAGPYGSGCSIEYGATDRIIEKMFYNCQNLRAVQLPASITEIEASAFWNCHGLEQIKIPDGVKKIGKHAFQSCRSLKDLRLPDSVTTIEEGAFRGCEQLCDEEGFVIVRSVLYGCRDLNGTVTVPPGVTTIDGDAFTLGLRSFNTITTEIIIPDGVENIDCKSVFHTCPNLEVVTISENPSDAAKELAKLVADRAEEKRRKLEAPKPVIIRKPEQLSVFCGANREIMSDSVYQSILSGLQLIRDNALGNGAGSDVRWSESETMVSLFDDYSIPVGHEDTISESVTLIFERLSQWDEPASWSAEGQWPCKGKYQYLDESVDEGDRWSYLIMHRKGWLLKEPFGLPGVWRFEHTSKRER